MSELPSHARVVIIGGGAVGTSALYHLARKGWTDVLLLEKNELTAGSTWHAAGNCPNFSASYGVLRLQAYSVQLFGTLGDQVDYPMTYHRTGSIRLAHSRDRMEEFKHVAALAGRHGLDFELLSPTGLKDRYEPLELHDLAGGLWDPTDGDIDPAQLTQAYAKGARQLGARIERFCPVIGLERAAGGDWRVQTPKGTVTAEIIVNAAGYYAPQIGAMMGREVPCVTLCHQYLVSDDIPDLDARADTLPLLRDVDDSYYLRQERTGLLLGPYEWRPKAEFLDGLPDDFSFQLFPDDLDRLEWYINAACARVPLLGTAGIKRVVNGPVPYTPDGNPLIGPVPGVRNAFEACAFSFGITQSGGAGKTLAEWVVDGETEWDLWGLDPRRFTDVATRSYVTAKALELYQHEYAIGYPCEERPAGRPAKTSPLYERLRAKGAQFGARGGWERAMYFAAPGTGRPDTLSFHRDEWPWIDNMRAESQAVETGCGLLDITGFGRFALTGPGAAAWLDGMITGKLPQAGRIGLCYFCAAGGGVVTEMTVTRWDAETFWLIGGAGAEWHDRDWLTSHLPADGSVTLANITSRYGTLSLSGPTTRDVLAAATDDDLSSAAFPWLSARSITIGMARIPALRVSYTGELGWELHVPMEHMLAVYDQLWATGAGHGLRDIGMYVLDSLRLEKCYRSWKADLTTEYSPLATSLDRFVSLDKAAFKGREALLSEKQQGVKERLVPLLVEANGVDAQFCSVVYQGEEPVGLVSSGGYGFRIDRSIALAFVRTDLAEAGTALEIDILGDRRRAEVAAEPLYDPGNARVRG